MSSVKGFFAAAMATVGAMAASMPATAASETQQARQQAAAEVQKQSILTPNQAAALGTVHVIAGKLPSGLSLELAKFLRDNSDDSDQAVRNRKEFGIALKRSMMGMMTKGPHTQALPELPPGAPMLSSVPTLDEVLTIYGLGVTVAWLEASVAVPDLAPWINVHNTRSVATYTKTKTTSTPAEGSFFVSGACTTRVSGVCTVVNATSITFQLTVTKDVVAGRTYKSAGAGADIDALVGTALDENINTDLLTFHVPLSISAWLEKTCSESYVFPTNPSTGQPATNYNQVGGPNLAIPSAFRGKSICITDNGTLGKLKTVNNDKVLATNAKYTFSYPITAGELATRATGTDILQVVYDALGTVWTQKPATPLAGNLFANIPALAPLLPLLPIDGTGDLMTQAPPVNNFGMQVDPMGVTWKVTTQVVNPTLEALKSNKFDVRKRHYTQDVNLGAYTGLPLPIVRLNWIHGPTVVYKAKEVRAGKIDIMAVRWHSLGTSTLGELIDNLAAIASQITTVPLPDSLAQQIKSAPASIYYDVPKGEYSLTDTATSQPRVDTQYDTVFQQDWGVAASPPSLVIPPTLPEAGSLIGSGQIEDIIGLLTGTVVPPTPVPLP